MNDQSSHSELPPSSADKWFNCHAWRRLTHDIEDTSSAAAEEGTRAHEWLADHLLKTRDLVNCDDPEMSDHLFMCVEWVQSQEGTPQIEIKVDFGAAFGFADLTGTADLIFDHKDYLTVADLKYGRQVVEVHDNKQLMCYLVGAVHKFGRRDKYQLAILQPRAWHKDGLLRTTWVSDQELRQFETALGEAIKASYNPKTKATAGPWCQHYCKALGRCKTAAAKSLDLFRSTPA